MLKLEVEEDTLSSKPLPTLLLACYLSKTQSNTHCSRLESTHFVLSSLDLTSTMNGVRNGKVVGLGFRWCRVHDSRLV